MPYATCPTCGDSFHLLVTKDIEKWNNEHPYSEDGKRYIECFGCWKELREYDVVKVWKVPEQYKNEIIEGDTGAVILLLESNGTQAYEIECANEDGSTKWQFALERKYVKYLSGSSSANEKSR